jgi:hypothetical protein
MPIERLMVQEDARDAAAIAMQFAAYIAKHGAESGMTLLASLVTSFLRLEVADGARDKMFDVFVEVVRECMAEETLQ